MKKYSGWCGSNGVRYRNTILFLLLFGVVVCSFQLSTPPLKYAFPVLKFFPHMPVPDDNIPTEEGVSLGRFLFYDPILSADSSFSCAACHRQEAAFSDSPAQFSTGIHGEKMKRNTMPLFNLAWYPALFWDGKAASLEDQVFHPVRDRNEMNLDWTTAAERIRKSSFYREKFYAAFGNREIDSTLVAKAIAQFERTLISHNSKYDRVLRGEEYFTPDEYEGFVLMNDQNKGDCLHCHTTDADALGTTAKFSNNGLDRVLNQGAYPDAGKGGISKRPAEEGLFKTPSLRNIAVTAPYMHDGRFATLGEVIDFYSEGVNSTLNIDSKMQFAHQGGVHLSKEEKRKVIAFLHTLTDSVFLTDPAFGNPW